MHPDVDKLFSRFTVIPQKSPEWYSERREYGGNLLTSSNMSKVLGISKYQSRKSYVDQCTMHPLDPKNPPKPNLPQEYGIKNEPQARELFGTLLFDVLEVFESPMLVSKDTSEGRMGTSPDGIIVIRKPENPRQRLMGLEIKCPFKHSMEVKLDYIIQVQHAMYITGLSRWMLYIWTPNKCRIVCVLFDQDFINYILDKCHVFERLCVGYRDLGFGIPNMKTKEADEIRETLQKHIDEKELILKDELWLQRDKNEWILYSLDRYTGDTKEVKCKVIKTVKRETKEDSTSAEAAKPNPASEKPHTAKQPRKRCSPEDTAETATKEAKR